MVPDNLLDLALDSIHHALMQREFGVGSINIPLNQRNSSQHLQVHSSPVKNEISAATG